MEKLIWHNEKRIVKDLIPFEFNPREMTEDQVKTLKDSLEKFDLVEVPAIDTDDRIVAGHMRVKVLSILGRGNEEIDVRVPNRKLTEEEFKEYNIRSNKNIGQWNYELLHNYFDEDLLRAIGFTDDDLIVGVGLSEAERQATDPERLTVITVQPPEAPKLKEHAHIHCENFEEYKIIKEAVLSGKITKEKLLELV